MEPRADEQVITTHGDIRNALDNAFEKGELAGARRERVILISILSGIRENAKIPADAEAADRIMKLLDGSEYEAFSPAKVSEISIEYGEIRGYRRTLLSLRKTLYERGVIGIDPLGRYHWLDPLGRSEGLATELEVKDESKAI